MGQEYSRLMGAGGRKLTRTKRMGLSCPDSTTWPRSARPAGRSASGREEGRRGAAQRNLRRSFPPRRRSTDSLASRAGGGGVKELTSVAMNFTHRI